MCPSVRVAFDLLPFAGAESFLAIAFDFLGVALALALVRPLARFALLIVAPVATVIGRFA